MFVFESFLTSFCMIILGVKTGLNLEPNQNIKKLNLQMFQKIAILDGHFRGQEKAFESWEGFGGPFPFQ